MAAVFQTRTGEADVGLFEARGAVGGPAEDGEGPRAELAFKAGLLLGHLDEGVVGGGEAVVADRGKGGELGAGAIRVGLGACGWHFGCSLVVVTDGGGIVGCVL